MIVLEVSVSKLEQEQARLSKIVDDGSNSLSASMAAGALSALHWLRCGGEKPSDVFTAVAENERSSRVQ